MYQLKSTSKIKKKGDSICGIYRFRILLLKLRDNTRKIKRDDLNRVLNRAQISRTRKEQYVLVGPDANKIMKTFNARRFCRIPYSVDS